VVRSTTLEIACLASGPRTRRKWHSPWNSHSLGRDLAHAIHRRDRPIYVSHDLADRDPRRQVVRACSPTSAPRRDCNEAAPLELITRSLPGTGSGSSPSPRSRRSSSALPRHERPRPANRRPRIRHSKHFDETLIGTFHGPMRNLLHFDQTSQDWSKGIGRRSRPAGMIGEIDVVDQSETRIFTRGRIPKIPKPASMSIPAICSRSGPVTSKTIQAATFGAGQAEFLLSRARRRVRHREGG